MIFTPTAAGPFSGNVTILSNAPTSPTVIPLQGTVITTGTINVSTNTASAMFRISGPASFTGTGQSATFANAPAGSYTIMYGPACRSDLPSSQMMTLLAESGITFTGTYAPGFLSVFPLRGKTACTAQVNSVFDHHAVRQYCADKKVVAYTGETGATKPSSFVTTAFCQITQNDDRLFGFSQSGGIPFSLHGQYVGAGQPQFLFYDGHPGYDYRASCHAPVLAAVSGTVHYPKSFPGVGSGKKFHVLEIDPDPPNQTYKVYYLHLSTYISTQCPSCSCSPLSSTATEGQHVDAGDIIGEVGDAGVPGNPHLHFEIQILGIPSHLSGVPVDPYGWQGSGVDPYSSRSSNVNLWK